MDFYCGDKGVLTLTSYTEHRANNLRTKQTTVKGELNFAFNNTNYTVECERPTDRGLAETLSLEVLKKCDPETPTSTIAFKHSTTGRTSLEVNESDIYDSNISTPSLCESGLNKSLHSTLGAVVAFLKGDSRKKLAWTSTI